MPKTSCLLRVDFDFLKNVSNEHIRYNKAIWPTIRVSKNAPIFVYRSSKCQKRHACLELTLTFWKMCQMNTYIIIKPFDLLYVSLKMHRFSCIEHFFPELLILCGKIVELCIFSFWAHKIHSKTLFSTLSFFIEETEPSRCIESLKETLTANNYASVQVRI